MRPSLITANHGRGPKIAGTRITVFDVLDYLKHGWHRDRIAALFRLASRDVQAAIDDIETHCEETEAEYQGILERHHSDRYPPDVQAKVERCWKLRELGLPGVAARYHIGFGERFVTRIPAPR